jgi:hypothetical protein
MIRNWYVNVLNVLRDIINPENADIVTEVGVYAQVWSSDPVSVFVGPLPQHSGHELQRKTCGREHVTRSQWVVRWLSIRNSFGIRVYVGSDINTLPELVHNAGRTQDRDRSTLAAA